MITRKGYKKTLILRELLSYEVKACWSERLECRVRADTVYHDQLMPSFDFRNSVLINIGIDTKADISLS